MGHGARSETPGRRLRGLPGSRDSATASVSQPSAEEHMKDDRELGDLR